VLREWRSGAVVRQIVQRYNAYEFVGEPAKDVELYGFNVLDRKDVYVKESRVSARGWGENYGRELARSENAIILTGIVPLLKPLRKEAVSGEEIPQAVEDAIGKLKARGYKPIVLVLNAWYATRALEVAGGSRRDDVIGEGQLGEKHFRRTPLYNLNYQYQGKPVIGVVDLTRFGKWRQYKPEQVLEGEQYISEGLSFCIRPYTRESAEELLRKRPELMRDREGRERSFEEAISEVQEQVHLRIVEQYEYRIIDESAGYSVFVGKEI
jgi:hypothetical protein